jgi:pimeloyl-ACP methyl ester carboxylesterase
MSIFAFKEYQLEFLTFGAGTNGIICFHGFGRKAQDFEVFQSLCSPNQRIVSINLFAHDNSVFPASRIENDPLKLSEWTELMVAFLVQEGIEDFDLVGYSMGGRVAMMTYLAMTKRVRSVLLIAPDGFKINKLYKFASGTKLGRSLYKKLIQRPEPLFKIADFLKRMGILNDKLHRFVYVHLDSKEKRQQVFDAWLIYRQMFPDLQELADTINWESTPFHMVFGKFDSVITVQLGERFSNYLGNKEHMYIIDLGHRLMVKQTAEFIEANELWPKEY